MRKDDGIFKLHMVECSYPQLDLKLNELTQHGYQIFDILDGHGLYMKVIVLVCNRLTS